MTLQGGVMVLIPAFNEQGAIANVVTEVSRAVPDAFVLVVDDRSEDRTVAEAKRAGGRVMELPVHLGLGGCVQAGYQLAFELGFEYVVRVDGDGQHDPNDIPKILAALREGDVEMVIGSRYLHDRGTYTHWVRGIGIMAFRALLRPILGKPVHDPTSGFVGVNRTAIQLFARSFPLDYPEIEALVVLQRKRFRFREVETVMRPRRTGRSSITALRSFGYLSHVLLGVFVNVLRK